MSWFGAAGYPAPPAIGAAPPSDPPPPPGDPPPPGGPSPPGGPHPEGPPSGGLSGSYFFMAFPKAFATRSSLVGIAFINPTVSEGNTYQRREIGRAHV